MTFAAVGSLIQASNTSTFSLTPGGSGDLILIAVANESSGSIVASLLSSSNVTWSQMGSTLLNAGNSVTMVVFAGVVTSTSAQTVTIAWSGTTPSVTRIAGREFSSTAGAWALDVQGSINSGTTNTWASLTPATPGELYFGYALDNGTAVAGSTSGYTYAVDVHSNGLAFNPSCASGVATAPVWGDSGQAFGIMVLVKETGGGTPHAAPPATALPAIITTFPGLA